MLPIDFSPTKSNSRNDSLLFVRGVAREKGTTTNVYENVINVLLLEHNYINVVYYQNSPRYVTHIDNDIALKTKSVFRTCKCLV